ncbi:MAG: A/G-specific adenine glycosylase [Patescibacteria group bacterium]
MSSTSSKIAAFRKIVLSHYRVHGRHDLPWRKTQDPYKILVSEMMLQQTQVERVIPYYKQWLKRFPTVRALAKAPLSEVLRAWQGLGYNRRAKMLHQAAKEVITTHKGKFPEQLEVLPGVGPYTARAVQVFSENKDAVCIETNIRTVVTHHFFPTTKKVDDKKIQEVLEKALPRGKSREWHSALMDYGSFLKRSGVRRNAQAKSYRKQEPFEGSRRQARGAILKALTKGPRTAMFLSAVLGPTRKAQLRAQLASLTKEGLIERTKGKFQLPN